MPNGPFAFGLFLSSYSPALLILALRAYGRSDVMFWAAIALIGVAAASFAVWLTVVRRGGPFRAEVVDVEPRDGDLAAYVATYLLPFLTVTGANAQDVVALGLFLLFIGVLWVRTGMVYLNPLLTLVGVYIYVVRVRPVADASTPADTLPRSFLMSRKPDLRVGERIKVEPMGRSVLSALSRSHDAAKT